VSGPSRSIWQPYALTSESAHITGGDIAMKRDGDRAVVRLRNDVTICGQHVAHHLGPVIVASVIKVRNGFQPGSAGACSELRGCVRGWTDTDIVKPLPGPPLSLPKGCVTFAPIGANR